MTEREKIIDFTSNRETKNKENQQNAIRELEESLLKLNQIIDEIEQKELDEVAPYAGTQEKITEPPNDELDKLYKQKFEMEKVLLEIKEEK